MDSPTNDWTLAVYVADAPRPASASGAIRSRPGSTWRPAPTTIDLDGRRGGAVLVWILDRGDGAGRAAAELREVSLTGTR